MDISLLMERRPSPQDSSRIFMPTEFARPQALTSLPIASPVRTAYIESWASSICNAFSMSPASSIRTASSMRTSSSSRSGIVASQSLPVLTEDSRESLWGQSVNTPISDHLIGQVTVSGKFVCLYSSCPDFSFGRQADFRGHFEHIHASDKGAPKLSKQRLLRHSDGRTSDQTIGYVTQSGKFRCIDMICQDTTFGRQADFRRHYDDTHVAKVEYFCPVIGCRRSTKLSGRSKGYSFGDREDKMKEHVRVVHEIGQIRECEEINGGTEGAHGTQERHVLLDIPQSEVQPTTSASTMSRALLSHPATIISLVSSIHTGPTATGTEALSVLTEAVTKVPGDQPPNALQLHDPVRVPDRVIDENIMAFVLSDEDSYPHEIDLEAPSSYQHARIRSEDGSHKVVSVISKTPYVRPMHPKIMCQYCNGRPEGFRGTHELDRHIARTHATRRKGYVCIDYPPDKRFLASCKPCQNKKVYDAYYNAAAHLRRVHFHPRKRGRKGKSDEKRGGIGGDDQPAMDYLKQHWIREVDVDNNIAQPVTPTSPRADEADDSKVANPPEPMNQQWGNQDIDFQHGNDSVPFTAFEQDLNFFPPDAVQLENLHLGNADGDAYQSVENIQETGHKRKREDTDVGNEIAYEAHGTDQVFETLFGLPEAEAWPTTHRLYEDSFAVPFAQTTAS